MIIKNNKKKKVFSNQRNIKQYNLDLRPEYHGQKIINNENIEVPEPLVIHELLLKFPIDKLSAIKNDVAHLEGYICKDFNSLKIRSKMTSGFSSKNVESITYAIFNKEILAREDFKRKMKNAGLVKLFNIDASLKLFSKIKIKDINDNMKSHAKIFGVTEVLDVGRVSNSPFRSPKKTIDAKNTSLFSIENKNSRLEIFNLNKLEEIRKRNHRSINKNNFKNLFNAHLKAGNDPARIISKTNYASQSLNKMIKGRLQKNHQIVSDYQNLGHEFHKLVDSLIPTSQNYYSLKRKRIPKVHEAVPVKVFLRPNVLRKINSNTFNIVVFAKDSQKRIIDYYLLNIDLKRLQKRKDTIEKCESVLSNEVSFMCKRGISDRPSISILNNSRFLLSCDVLQSTYRQGEIKNKYFFGDYKNQTVFPRRTQKVYADKKTRLSKKNSYFYRMKVGYEDITFDNTFFDDIAFTNKVNSFQSYSVNITCKNDAGELNENNVKIKVSDVPDEIIALNVVKRNLTKKEKDFSIIKTYGQKTNLQKEADMSSLDLKDNKVVFINRKRSSINERVFNFIDNDIEIGDTYEYKALLYEDNCVTCLSTNSSTIQYEERKKIISMRISNLNLDISRDQSEQLENQTGFGTARINLKVKDDNFDKLFESLDRNAYEAFSSEFDELKESLKKNISCIVNCVNKSTGEKTHVGIFEAGKNKTFNVRFEIGDVFSDYSLEVIPRLGTLSQNLENIVNKIERLPLLQRNLPIYSFARNFRKLTNINLNSQNSANKIISKKTIEKYTSKSIKLFGLILDPQTRFNQELDDVYFEGSTGDTYYFDVYNSKRLKKENSLKFISYSDLSYSDISDTKDTNYKKLGILKSRPGSSSQAVNFYAIYSKSNGTISFLGMISPNDFQTETYNFIVDLEEEIGISEIYSVCVLKNGEISSPNLLTTLLCTESRTRIL